MKKVIGIVLAVLLVGASVFGVVLSVEALSGAYAATEDYAYDRETASTLKEDIANARDGVRLLMENEESYLSGSNAYSEDLISHTFNKESSTKLTGLYNEYNKALAEYEEAKQAADAISDDYNETKETISKIEPLMPYLNKYIEYRDGTIESLPGFDSAQQWFVSVVRPIGAQLGLEVPEDVTDFPVYVQQIVAEGQAQLKEYEPVFERLEEAEQKLADVEARIAAAHDKQDADKNEDTTETEDEPSEAENERLNVFEQGEVSLMEGIYRLFEAMTPCYSASSGETVLVSLPEQVADELGIAAPKELIVENGEAYELDTEAYAELCDSVALALYLVDENGDLVTVGDRYGFTLLDLDKCALLLDKAEQYLADRENLTVSEGSGNKTSCILSIAAAALCIVCAIFVTVKNLMSTGKVLGIVGCVFGSLGAISAAVTLVMGNMAQLRTVSIAAMVALAVLLVVLTVVFIATDTKKKVKAAQYGYNYMYYGK